MFDNKGQTWSLELFCILTLAVSLMVRSEEVSTAPLAINTLLCRATSVFPQSSRVTCHDVTPPRARGQKQAGGRGQGQEDGDPGCWGREVHRDPRHPGSLPRHQVQPRHTSHVTRDTVSRLGKLVRADTIEKVLELCDEFTPGDPPEYFFDRNPDNFPAILNMYRTGVLLVLYTS